MMNALLVFKLLFYTGITCGLQGKSYTADLFVVVL